MNEDIFISIRLNVMVAKKDGPAAIFSSFQDKAKSSSGSVINIFICFATVGSQQLFSFAVFTCPCPKDVNKTTDAGVPENAVYGWAYIIVPALALFVAGYAMNIKTWKLTTGCIKRSSKAARGCSAGCATLFEIFMQALVAPLTWVSVALLDGRYYACATTKNPYSVPCKVVINQKEPKYSVEFVSNRHVSQVGGMIIVAITLLGVSTLYMLYRCCSPLSYHHRLYATWYREQESKTFKEKALEQIKAEDDKIVERFLRRKRNKHQWDKISTVFTFTRDDRNYALYSRLDEWNELYKDECSSSDEDIATENRPSVRENIEIPETTDDNEPLIKTHNKNPNKSKC